MEVRLTRLGDVPVLETEGEIDHNTSRVVENALQDALTADTRIVLFDLTRVSYIDSGGLSVLFSATRRLRDDGWLGVIGANANVRRLLELVGLLADPSFRSFDDKSAAEVALAGETGL